MKDFVTGLQFEPVVVTEPQRADAHNLNEVQGLRDALEERIVSRPPPGMRQIFNWYFDPDAERFVIVIEGASVTETQTISFKIAELAQVVTIITKTLLEHNVLPDEELAEGTDLDYIFETLQDDLDAEI